MCCWKRFLFLYSFTFHISDTIRFDSKITKFWSRSWCSLKCIVPFRSRNIFENVFFFKLFFFFLFLSSHLSNYNYVSGSIILVICSRKQLIDHFFFFVEKHKQKKWTFFLFFFLALKNSLTFQEFCLRNHGLREAVEKYHRDVHLDVLAQRFGFGQHRVEDDR